MGTHGYYNKDGKNYCSFCDREVSSHGYSYYNILDKIEKMDLICNCELSRLYRRFQIKDVLKLEINHGRKRIKEMEDEVDLYIEKYIDIFGEIPDTDTTDTDDDEVYSSSPTND